jgi:hypothetical protein
MQHAAALGVKGRYQKLEPVIFGIFGVPFMARLTISPRWAGLVPEQKYGRRLLAHSLAGIGDRDHDVVPGGQIQRPLSIIRRDIACNNLDDAAKRYGVQLDRLKLGRIFRTMPNHARYGSI